MFLTQTIPTSQPNKLVAIRSYPSRTSVLSTLLLDEYFLGFFHFHSFFFLLIDFGTFKLFFFLHITLLDAPIIDGQTQFESQLSQIYDEQW